MGYELSPKTAQRLKHLLADGLPSLSAQVTTNNADRYDCFVKITGVADVLGYYPALCTEWDTSTGTWVDFTEEVWVFPANDWFTLGNGYRYRALNYGATSDSGEDRLVFVVDAQALLADGCNITTTADADGYIHVAVNVPTLAGSHLTTEPFPDDSDSTNDDCLRLAVDLSDVPGCGLVYVPATEEDPSKLKIDQSIFGTGFDIDSGDCPTINVKHGCWIDATGGVDPDIVGPGLIHEGEDDSDDSNDDAPCKRIAFPLEPKTDVPLGPYVLASGFTFSKEGCNLVVKAYTQGMTAKRNKDGVVVNILQGPAAPAITTLGTVDMRTMCDCCDEEPPGWACVDGECVEGPGYDYPSQEACNTATGHCDSDSDSDSDDGCCDLFCDAYTITPFIHRSPTYDGTLDITLTKLCDMPADCTGITVGHWQGTDPDGVVWYLYYNGSGYGLVMNWDGSDPCGTCNFRWDEPVELGECAEFTPTTCCALFLPGDKVDVCCGTTTYDCIDNVCVEAIGDTGEFETIEDCEAACGDSDSDSSDVFVCSDCVSIGTPTTADGSPCGRVLSLDTSYYYDKPPAETSTFFWAVSPSTAYCITACSSNATTVSVVFGSSCGDTATSTTHAVGTGTTTWTVTTDSGTNGLYLSWDTSQSGCLSFMVSEGPCACAGGVNFIPGTTCDDSPVLSLGVTYNYTNIAPYSCFYFPVTPGHSYMFSSSLGITDIFTMTAYGCANALGNIGGAGGGCYTHNLSIDYGGTIAHFLWCRVNYTGYVGGEFCESNLRVVEGTCP